MTRKLYLLAVSAILLLLSAAVIADVVEGDKLALLDFLEAMPHGRVLNWDDTGDVCGAWAGITCSHDGRRVIGVHLPGVALEGTLPPNTLSRLSALQVLSLRSNSITGTFPADFANLTALTGLHLQYNLLSGPLPSDFSPWKNLTVLDLSFNFFNGSIPSSLSDLYLLTALNLSNNSLFGQIPALQLPDLQFLNLSYNHLDGYIPESLQRFSNSSFSGNDLFPFYPDPVAPPPLPFPPTPTRRLTKKIGHSVILVIIVGGCALAFGVLSVCLLLFCSSKEKEEGAPSVSALKDDRSPEKAVAKNPDERNRLVFFEGCIFVFDLEDLLTASAELLGKGTFGTTYRAVLEDGTTVVVKRLKEIGVGKKEFDQQMELLGRVRHENVVELKAYYYSKEERLIVYDNCTHGSLSSLLHGKKETPLDWPTRLRIAVGAARGLARLHAENGGKLIHGNVKSTNIFLNSDLHGSVSDAVLPFLMNYSPSRFTGYRAPEVADVRRLSQPSDVYSFGVVLLELLTGKSAVATIGGAAATAAGEVVYLVRWVHSVVREEWTAEVFDVELMKYPGIEEEMVELLQIAMACVDRMPEQRPLMADVEQMIQVVSMAAGGRMSSETKSGDRSGGVVGPWGEKEPPAATYW